VPFTLLLFALGVALAFGMASTFKYVGDEFPNNLAWSAASLAWWAASAASCFRSYGVWCSM
jgi:hypothetical protein